MKPQRQSYKRALSCCQSLGRRLYNEHPRGGQKLGWTDLPKIFVLHHVMCMLNVWLGRAGWLRSKKLSKKSRVMSGVRF